MPPYFGYKYRVVWSKVENEKFIKDIKHNVVRKILPFMNISKGIELHYQADLPARSGMGSSSSFVVGLLNIISKYKNLSFSNKELAKKYFF